MMRPPFFVDGNSLDYFEGELSGPSGNEVRVLLLEAIERSEVCAPFPIRDEYTMKNDPPIFLEDVELKRIFHNTKNPQVASAMVQVVKDHPKVRQRTAKTRRDPGDPWLVANAKVTGGTVVTEEIPSANGLNGRDSASLKKIPDICERQSVYCSNGAGFLDWCRENYNV